jgi:ABC-type Fe3+-hydroxamate transport system substrate-binding protein
MKRLLVIPVLALALAGCGSSDSSDEQPASTNPSSPPAMGTTSTVDCQLEGATKAPQVNASSDAPDKTMYLTNVSFKDADCASSVAFDLKPRNLAPGYRVSYETAETAKVEDGSGNSVEIEGNAFLVVKLMPAMTATIDGEQVTKTYTGPNRLPGEGPITEVVKTGDFESVVTWVIGLDRVRPFLVTASDGILFVDIESS